jgi:integrase
MLIERRIASHSRANIGTCRRFLARAIPTDFRPSDRDLSQPTLSARDCLETIDGQTSLVWNNRKGKRNKRRLPIDESTAEEIRAWHRRRDHVPSSARAHGYLFPAPTDEGAFAHLDPIKIASAIRAWVDALPALDTDAIGNDGKPAPFDRAKVFPYVFRHSYAQRHADAGTAVDVLKEPMDHAEITTTMGVLHRLPEAETTGGQDPQLTHPRPLRQT